MTRSGKKKLGMASHPLMPAPIATPIGVRWVKKTHAWTGISTAILALIFAWSGFMLNHRTHFTLGAPALTDEFTIPAPLAGFGSPQDLADFLHAEFGLRTSPTLESRDAATLPAGMGMGMGQAAADAAPATTGPEPAGTPPGNDGAAPAMATDAPAMGGGRRGGGGAAVQGPSFSASWQAPGGDFSGEWVVGSGEVAISRSDRGFNRIVNRLHSGRGLEGGAWHFVISAYAVMLLFLSLTGVMLWSRVSGPAKVGGGLLGASLLLIGAWIIVGP